MAAKALKGFITGLLFFRRPKSRRNDAQVSDALPDSASSEPLTSESGSGCVYWGQLPDGTQIAVKRLHSSEMKPELPFTVEAQKMGRMQHKNVLKLRGYCVERQERILVYDFMPNSSLLAHLHGALSYESQLDWQNRVAIALGCAEGLAFLHDSNLVHGNIKASNILLDSDNTPMYSEYGLSSLMKRPIVLQQAGASLGYTAPECSAGEEATSESDVFSFGILILELISGRRPMEKVEFGMRRHIVEWAEPIILDGSLQRLLDPKLDGQHTPDELNKLVYVATICAQTKPAHRPRMSRVVDLLRSRNITPTTGWDSETRTSPVHNI